MRRLLLLTALPCLFLSGCGPGGLQPGGQYSGVPDTLIGDPQRNRVTGTLSTGGTIRATPGGPAAWR